MSTIPSSSQVSSTPTRWSKTRPLRQRSKVTDRATTWQILLIAVSLTSNAALLICQQVAIRLLAPLIGSSIETWSAILGVFLLGIAIGNFIAGKLADRCSASRLIAFSLFISGFSVCLMQLVVFGLSKSTLFISWPLEMQTIIASFAVCLLPGIALSLVTPPLHSQPCS